MRLVRRLVCRVGIHGPTKYIIDKNGSYHFVCSWCGKSDPCCCRDCKRGWYPPSK